MNEFKFKPEDFTVAQNFTPLLELVHPSKDTEKITETMNVLAAKQANAKLKEWLDVSLVVVRTEAEGYEVWQVDINPTHNWPHTRAKLVCIEEIK